MNQTLDVSSALVQYYTPYAKYVAQTRALCDSRDGLKQGARFILYAQYLDKLTHKHKARKAVDTIAASMKFSVHGDNAIIANAVRMSQAFSMRYPLIYVKGNNGSQIDGSSVFSAPRYLEMCSNEIAGEMVSLLEKNTIDTWEWNYTQERQYPTVFPSLFPNFINGSIGLGVGLSSSIPQWNLVEVCKSAIKLLENPNSSFDSLYCAPDFCTGGILLNEAEVKESLKKGSGKSAVLRAKVEYHADVRELIVTELPYLVTSSQVLAQIQKAIDEVTINGIASAFDSSDISGVKIVIKLAKGANPETVLKGLYKLTSLQSYYSINMNMLKNGTTPQLFSFVEILQEYLNHIQVVLKKAVEYDINQTRNRLELIEGLLKAIANIDRVVEIIRNSNTKEQANLTLKKEFNFTNAQVDNILDLRLQRLIGLESIKLQNEQNKLEETLKSLTDLIASESNFQNYVKKEIERIANTYGDKRRTVILNNEIKNDEVIETIQLIVYLTNFNNLYIEETSSLIAQKRGGRGNKIKLLKNEQVVKTINSTSNKRLILFSNIGRVYAITLSQLLENPNVDLLLNLQAQEKIIQITPEEKTEFVLFVTKDGYVKKSNATEYLNIRNAGSIGIKLREGDSLLRVLFTTNEKLAFLTNKGYFKIIETQGINPIGRNTIGVIGIKLNDEDYLVDAQIVSNIDKEVLSFTEIGMGKRVSLEEFPMLGRNTKGKKIQDGSLLGFILIEPSTKEITVSSSKNVIKIPVDSFSLSSPGGVGQKIMTLKEENLTGVIKNQ